MYDLWLKFSSHPNLKDILEDFNDQDFSLRVELGMLPVGETSWCMVTMKRLELLHQCQIECIKYKTIEPTHSDICSSCNIQFHYNHAESTKVCTNCGLSYDVLLDHEYNYSSSDRYNGPRRHHYEFKEHFSQTLCDFTCSGQRTVPIKVMAYCRCALGRGKHVTSANVFTVLQLGGYSRYYQHKYEIAHRLRGSMEFKISSREISQLRDAYKRYQQEFIPFQEAHFIGTHSRTGKPRMYWPMRYILGKMCEEINRGDLKQFIRGIKDKTKLDRYDYFWTKLKRFIDSSRPARTTVDPSHQAKMLRPCHRPF